MTHTVILRGDQQRELARSYIASAPADAVVKISKPGRTLSQNDKMWALLSAVSKAKPGGRCHTPEVWKGLFMKACGHAVQFEMGLDGEPFPMGFKTSRLTKEEMSELIEFTYAWSAQNNINLQDYKDENEIPSSLFNHADRCL